MRIWRVMVLAGVVLMGVGCSAAALPRGTFVAGSVEVGKGDPIQTYEGYRAAVEAAEKDEGVPAAHGQGRVVAIVRALARLRSEASQRYARALVEVLRSHGVAAEVALSGEGGGAISYGEMAKSEALTGLFFRTGEKDVVEGALAPAGLDEALALAIVKYSPSDTGAGEGMSLYFNGSGEDYPSVADKDDAARYGRAREVMEIFFARLVTPGRRMNLSSLQFYEQMTGTSLAMLIGGYSNVIKGKEEWENVDPRARKLLEELAASAERARGVDRSEAVQGMLTKFVEDAREKLEYFDRGEKREDKVNI